MKTRPATSGCSRGAAGRVWAARAARGVRAARVWLGALLLVVLSGLAAAVPAVAAEAAPASSSALLKLPGGAADVDAWHSVRLLSDPAHALTAEQAFAAVPTFVPPTGRRANLGRRNDTVWLHVAIEPARTGWWLAIDYPSLDEAEVFVLREGRVVQRTLTGDHLPTARRETAARMPLVELHALVPGVRHELLLRVRTTSAMILPLRLLRADALAHYDGQVQAAQGLMLGVGLSMLVYALVVGLLQRDLTFLWFALATASSTLFFASYYGMGALYLWPGSEWLTRNASPLMMLLVLASGTMFVNRSLDLPLQSPRLSWLMRGIAMAATAAALLYVAGALGYRGASAVSTWLGLWPMLLSLPVAFRRALGGDATAWLTFVGWLIYAVGVVVLAGLQSGQLRFNDWTHYALQATSMVQMVAWVMILSVRAARQRRQAAQARREHERLRMIAQTDPLTGLLNRRGLAQALATLLPAARADALVAVYVIDLDAFKPVNDSHGHDAGDELLVQMAARLKAALRSADLVARTGGDEFVIVAGHLKGVREAEQIGQKLLACCDDPFELKAARCSIGMTVGYALAPTDGLDPDQLIKRADAAMYAGKQAGRRRVARAGLAPA